MKGAFTPNTNNWSHATNSRLQLTTQLTVISCLTTEKNHSNVAVIIYAAFENCCIDCIFQLSDTFLQILASVMIFGITRDSWCNPPGSAPSHRAGLEPGMPAREAGALPRRLKLQPLRQSQSASFWGQEWGLHTALTGIHRYTHPPKPHSRAGHGTNVTPPGPHHHTKQVSNPGRRRGRRALYQGG